MIEINKKKFKNSKDKKIYVKMSNMNMKISINENKNPQIPKHSLFVNKSNISKHTLPSFTKKIFSSISYFK